jgi:hypothetical protein
VGTTVLTAGAQGERSRPRVWRGNYDPLRCENARIVDQWLTDQVRGEVTCRDLWDLRNRGHARRLASRRARTAVGPEDDRLIAGQQDARQNGLELLRRGQRAGAFSDGLGHRIGLLGGNAALLDRVNGAVTGCPDAIDARDSAVPVHWKEANRVVGQTLDRWSAEFWQGDDTVDLNQAISRMDADRFARRDVGVCGQDQLDPALVQQLGDALTISSGAASGVIRVILTSAWVSQALSAVISANS